MVVFAFISVVFAPACGPSDEAPRRPKPSEPVELGRIAWRRGFDSALRTAQASNLPLLVLFDEVPGCSTCTGYGHDVLSHPLVVEAAETLFVPVAVYNNVKGADERTLRSFAEPAWNNPVVRIVAPDRSDLVPRLSGDYTTAGLAHAMLAALEKAKRPSPAWLRLLAEESAGRRRAERAAFTVGCFWQAEGALGDVAGVVGTTPGFLNGVEAVEVEFDPQRLPYDELVERANRQCGASAITRSDEQQRLAMAKVGKLAIRSDERLRPDKQPKYYLSKSPLRHVPMTALQACRANAALARPGGNPEDVLSPRQARLLSVIRRNPRAAWPDAIGAHDLASAWDAAQAVADRQGAREGGQKMQPPATRPSSRV